MEKTEEYAKQFANILGVTSIGVEGTTFYGTEEISAGRIKETSDPGTFMAWKYDVSQTGINISSYSLNQHTGKPFLRKR